MYDCARRELQWGKYKRKSGKKKFWVYPINVDRLFLLFVAESFSNIIYV